MPCAAMAHSTKSIYLCRNRLINMDYSICQAMKWFPQHLIVLIIFNICCQWIIHFREHISKLEFLELCDSIKIIGAVGKFHLAVHILECFHRFTLNFIEGAGEVDGKIWKPCGPIWMKCQDLHKQCWLPITRRLSMII